MKKPPVATTMKRSELLLVISDKIKFEAYNAII